MAKHNIYTMSFAKLYPLYVQKAERKGKTKEEVDKILMWLTGYEQSEIEAHMDNETSVEVFLTSATNFNPKSSEIKGVVCGVRVEAIEEPVMQKIRYMDKLIDELAKGKSMDKILR